MSDQLREIKGAQNWSIEVLGFYTDDVVARWTWMDDWHKERGEAQAAEGGDVPGRENSRPQNSVAVKAFIVPARYAPEIESVIRSAVAHIERNMRQRDLGGITDYVDVDDSLTGNLVVLVGETSSKPELVTSKESAA